MKRKPWLVPALLGGVVTMLVFSTRRASASSGAETPPGPYPEEQRPSAPPPGGTQPPPEPPPPSPEVVLEPGSILAVYNSLMGAMQADIHSVDPMLLERLVAKLVEFGHPEEAKLAGQRALCAREVFGETDLDFFPLSCAAPGHVVFEVPQHITQATADLLRRYADGMSKRLYASSSAIPIALQNTSITVPYLDALIHDLEAGSLRTEAASLRARRDQLYQLILDNALTRLRSAKAENVNRENYIVTELKDAGYDTTLAETLRQAIYARKGEVDLRPRTHTCNVQYGRCEVRSGYNITSPLLTTLPHRTPVTVLRTEGAWSEVAFDKTEGAPFQGWILTHALAPIA